LAAKKTQMGIGAGRAYRYESCLVPRSGANLGTGMEAPPSTPSRFGTEGTDSATMETVMERHEADRPADAGDLKRQ